MHGFIWNIDPDIFHIFGRPVRYYGLLFAMTILIGYKLFQKHLEKEGYPEKVSEKFLLIGTLATVIGARLGHCFFYEDAFFYLTHPFELIAVWKGGLASHGATIGLILAAVYFSKTRKIHFFRVADAIVLAASVGAAFVRIGNFMNSEIVGRITDVPWAVKFLRYDNNFRHPSQLYEAFGGFLILAILLIVDKKTKKGTRGILTSIFLMGYFTFRFLIEFVKEYQTLSTGLTMGQWLSIPFVLVGLAMLIYSVKQPVTEAVIPKEMLAPIAKKGKNKK